ncbi:MAG: hypothetical protein Q8P39_01675 [Candidatus Yanofskybacteria bacterium]|nr:hypothetical protein [Candidatus Yanofskybacteria bacterium]
MKPETILRHEVAWRSWKVETQNDELRLRSVVAPEIWEPKKQMEASCSHYSTWNMKSVPRRKACRCEEREEDEIPNLRGQCGIYALPTLQAAAYPDLRSQFLYGRIVGKVKVWGTLWEGDTGLRAEFAYPATLECGVCEICSQIFPIEELWLVLRGERRAREFPDSSYTLQCRKHLMPYALLAHPPGWHGKLLETYALQQAA